MPSLIIDASDLKRAVAAVKPVIPARTTIPVVMCARLVASGGTLTMTGCNFDQQISIAVPAEGTDSWCIDFGKLQAFAGAVPAGGQVRIDGDSTVTLKCGKLQARISAFPAEDFPEYAQAAGEREITMPVSAFRDAVARVANCRMRDGSHQNLAGIHLMIGRGAMTVEATDGKVMARLSVDLGGVSGDVDVILPGEIVQAMSGLPDGDMAMRVSPSMISLSSGGVTVHSKMIDSTYPEIDRAIKGVVPSMGKPSSFDTANLAAAIKAASVSQTWDSERVVLAVDDDGAAVIGSGGAGEEIVVPVDCEPGDPFEMGAAPGYLLALLAAAKRETIRLAPSQLAICCLEDGAEFRGLVMTLKGKADTMKKAA